MNQDTLHLDVTTVANELKATYPPQHALTDNRQGEALELPTPECPNFNGKHFYIESYGCQMKLARLGDSGIYPQRRLCQYAKL